MSCTTPWVIAAYYVAPKLTSPQCLAVLQQPQGITHCTPAYYAFIFALTCLLEAFIYLPSHRKTVTTLPKQLWLAVLPNLTTHPAVYFAFPWLISRLHGTYAQTLTFGELFAPLCEGLLLWCYWKDSPSKAASVAIAANLFSWTVGACLGL